MRTTKLLHEDQQLATRFLAVFARGLSAAGQGKSARPGFFVFSGNFIHEYLEPVYFKKEAVLLSALEDCGFSPEDGPIGSMYAGQQKSRQISQVLFDAAKEWQGGDEGGRAEVIYAASEYTQIMHQHFELLRDLIHPLLAQSLSPDGELKAAEALNHIAFDEHSPDSLEKYIGMVKMLEEEVEAWK